MKKLKIKIIQRMSFFASVPFEAKDEINAVTKIERENYELFETASEMLLSAQTR